MNSQDRWNTRFLRPYFIDCTGNIWAVNKLVKEGQLTFQKWFLKNNMLPLSGRGPFNFPWTVEEVFVKNGFFYSYACLPLKNKRISFRQIHLSNLHLLTIFDQLFSHFSGTQRVISFLRQILEYGGFYRTADQTWVKFERIQFVGACNPPTDPGRKPLSHR